MGKVPQRTYTMGLKITATYSVSRCIVVKHRGQGLRMRTIVLYEIDTILLVHVHACDLEALSHL